MSNLFDFAVTTIFVREVLEGSIIIGEYRTIIQRCRQWPEGVTQALALRAVTVSALTATLCAIVVCLAIALPLALLSKSFDPRISNTIEGISKIVAAICILQLSLKLPKWLGVYYSRKPDTDETLSGLSLRSIRFNVTWNIWREVAECGVFLIPFFLTGENTQKIPLSAVVGSTIGFLLGYAIYYANKRAKNNVSLAIFMSSFLVVLSAGLFTGGCNSLETVFGRTPIVWRIKGDFWSATRLPMTIFKPFGYSDKRTILQIVSYWSWLFLSVAIHSRKWRKSQQIRQEIAMTTDDCESSLSVVESQRSPSRTGSVDLDVEASSNPRIQ